MAIVGQLVPAGMPQHVGVRLDTKLGRNSRPLHHSGEARRCQGRPALRNEYERRADAFPLMATQLRPGQSTPSS
jgi:hypothetical protein